MKVLVFDTETSGLPPKYNNNLLEINKWPYILQIAWILYDTEKNLILDKYVSFIKVDLNIKIEEKSIEIHKITHDKLQSKGKYIVEVLNKFNTILKLCDIIIGHNLSFDKNILLVEAQRNGIVLNFMRDGAQISQYCTMFNSINLCKISFPNSNNNYKNSYKYPKLSELVYYLFKEENINFHDAIIDVIYTLRCYYRLQKNLDLFQIDLTFNKLLN